MKCVHKRPRLYVVCGSPTLVHCNISVLSICVFYHLQCSFVAIKCSSRTVAYSVTEKNGMWYCFPLFHFLYSLTFIVKHNHIFHVTLHPVPPCLGSILPMSKNYWFVLLSHGEYKTINNLLPSVMWYRVYFLWNIKPLLRCVCKRSRFAVGQAFDTYTAFHGSGLMK